MDGDLVSDPNKSGWTPTSPDETFEPRQFFENSDMNAKKTSQSPIIPARCSPSWSPKVSVKGDYDQFARQPRKDKTKTSTRSPKFEQRGGKQERDLRDQQTSPLSKNGTGKSEVSERSSTSHESETNNVTNDKSETVKEGKIHPENFHSNMEQTSATMSVANLPWDNNIPDNRHKLSRLDSLPPRKQPRVEHMKQMRDEGPEYARFSGHSNVLPSIDHRERPPSDIQGASTSNRTLEAAEGNAFTAPVASVVDFLENPDFRHRVAVVNKSFLDDVLRTGRVDPIVMSRFSTNYMVRYLRGEQRDKKMISSMLVRPILPPIASSKRRKQAANNENLSVDELVNEGQITGFEIINGNALFRGTDTEKPSDNVKESKNSLHKQKGQPGDQNLNDMTYHFRRGTRLRQGDSKYVYKPSPHHSTAVIGATTNSPREVLDMGGEIEEDFDRVVRWKSKARYCGKPAMYKRTTSPTLGEEAIRRKLTDRLPTRQNHKLWPEPNDLYSETKDRMESWRRPPSNQKSPPALGPLITHNTAVKPKYHRRVSLVSIGNFSNNPTVLVNATSRHPGVALPPPQLPERKRRPMWQRM